MQNGINTIIEAMAAEKAFWLIRNMIRNPEHPRFPFKLSGATAQLFAPACVHYIAVVPNLPNTIPSGVTDRELILSIRDGSEVSKRLDSAAADSSEPSEARFFFDSKTYAPHKLRLLTEWNLFHPVTAERSL